MSGNAYACALEVCQIHAVRLRWALAQLRPRMPMDDSDMQRLSGSDIAVIDQMLTRFSHLQDVMGAKLFPAVLELTQEPGVLAAFIDKLHRLENIGAIESSDEWELLREVRNRLTHDYPDDPALQAATVTQVFMLALQLLCMLDRVREFAEPYR